MTFKELKRRHADELFIQRQQIIETACSLFCFSCVASLPKRTYKARACHQRDTCPKIASFRDALISNT